MLSTVQIKLSCTLEFLPVPFCIRSSILVSFDLFNLLLDELSLDSDLPALLDSAT